MTGHNIFHPISSKVTNFHNDLNTNINSHKYFEGYRILNYNSEHQNTQYFPDL